MERAVWKNKDSPHYLRSAPYNVKGIPCKKFFFFSRRNFFKLIYYKGLVLYNVQTGKVEKKITEYELDQLENVSELLYQAEESNA